MKINNIWKHHPARIAQKEILNQNKQIKQVTSGRIRSVWDQIWRWTKMMLSQWNHLTLASTWNWSLYCFLKESGEKTTDALFRWMDSDGFTTHFTQVPKMEEESSPFSKLYSDRVYRKTHPPQKKTWSFGTWNFGWIVSTQLGNLPQRGVNINICIIYVYLEPKWPLFLKSTPQNKAFSN